MENQPLEPKKVGVNLESFKSHSPDKFPWQIKAVAIFMIYSGITDIYLGVIMMMASIILLAIFIILGIFNIKYAVDLFKMKKKGYVGAVVLNIGGILFFLLVSLYASSVSVGGFRYSPSLFTTVISIITLYYYRDKFVY